MWNEFELCCSADVTITDNYCTNGVFRVRNRVSPEEQLGRPDVQASFRNGRMVVAIDKNVILMDNDGEGSCELLNYDANIDCISTVNGGQIVVCGLVDGHVHGLLINGIPVFDLCIQKDDHTRGAKRTFVGIFDHYGQYFLMTCSGALYTLEGLSDDLNLEQHVTGNDTLPGNRTMVYDKTLLSPVSLRRVFKPVFGKLQVLAYTIIGCPDAPTRRQILYCDSSFTYQHALDGDVTPEQVVKVKLPKSFDVIKKIVNLENYILLLTVAGKVYKYCAFSKTVVLMRRAQWPLEDLLVLENDLDASVELMVLERKDNERILKIVNFPEMKANYELPLSEHCWLVAQPKSSMNMYYMEGMLDDAGEDEEEGGDRQRKKRPSTFPNAVELKQITELDPMQRFKKLVYRGLIDEAEAFAKEMNLSLEVIHEHRVHAFVIRIANERNSEALTRTFKEFMQLLESVHSVQLLASQRLMDIPDRGLKERFLKFLRGKLLKRDTKVKLENESTVMGELEEQLNRLDTLKIIDAYSLDWHNFTHEQNLVKCCLRMLKTNEQDASLIWSRHSNAIVPFISVQDLPKVLASLPKDSQLIDILHWLRHITPSLMQVHSTFMAMAVKWCVEKTKSLESTSMWPANGLQFMKDVYSIFSARVSIVTDLERMSRSNMNTINQMVSVLQELAELKSEFNLTIKLDSYCGQDLDKTALNLLQRVQINHLRKLLTDFIMPLFLKSNKSADCAMAQYIQFLVENRKFTSQWQEKAVLVIEMLSNEDDRLQMALLVLNIAPVPWIDDLKPLIAYGRSSHHLAAEIVAKHQLQTVKMIRIRYDYPPNASNNNNMQLVYRIVKLGRETMVAELQSIVQLMPQLATKIYTYCIAHWIQHEKLELALVFFNDFSASPDIEVLFIYFETAFETASELHMQNVIHFLNIIASRSLGAEERESIDGLKVVYKLRTCYGIRLGSTANLVRKSKWILDEGIAAIEVEMRMKLGSCGEEVLEQAFLSLTHLCQLLKFDCVVGVIKMAQKVNLPAFTFAMVSLLLDWDAAPVTKSNYEDHIQLGVLILAQVIEHLTTTKHEDLPMYPLAYETLARCMSYAKLDVIELNQLLPLIRIGKNMYRCLDCARFFEQNKKSLTGAIAEAFAVTTGKEASRRESSRKSRRDSYSVFNETMSDIAADTPVVAATAAANNYKSTNVGQVVNCLSVMLEIMVLKEDEQKTIMSGRFRKFFDSDFKVMDLDVLGRGFTQVVNQLYQNKMLWQMHLIFHEMLKMQKRLGFVIINAQYSLVVTRKLLGHMLAQEEVDIQDCYLILIKASPREMLAALESDMKMIMERRNFYALAEHYHISVNKLERAAEYKALRVKYTYLAEVSKQNPTVKLSLEKFNASALPLLKMELGTLKKLCHEFGCDYQEVVTERILQILRTKELKFEVVQDELGVEKIKVLTSVASICEPCVPLVNEISAERVPVLAKRLIKFAESVDSYFYEMYLVIIEMLALRDTLPQLMAPWKGILSFLLHKMVTRRRVRPSQVEMEWWSKTQHEASVIPKIAKYRFPFLRLQQSRMETLGEEINVENCESWFPLISAFGDHAEDIEREMEAFCSRAVKNSINEWKMQTEDNRNEDVWHLMPENNDFLQSVLRLVRHSKISEYKAFSILYYTMNHMPEGADQVDAAFECYRFMVEHEDTLLQVEKAKEAVAKIRRKYPLLKTQHLLHVYQMTDDSLMESIEKPLDLIASLYLHPVILHDMRPNVLQLTTEIAEVHNLPLHAIQVMLLRKLLRLDQEEGVGAIDVSVMDNYADESVMILDNVDLQEVNEQLLKSIKLLSNYEITHRVNYILSGWEDAEAFLITQMLGLRNAVAPEQQAKYILMYECLASMHRPSDESKQVIGMFKQEEFITCKIVYLLHKIQFQFDKAPVSACVLLQGNRIEMLKELWKSYAKTPEMLEAMVLICLRFNIAVKEIWDSMLKKMIGLHMKQMLLSVIDWMGARPEFAMLASVPLAIQYILMEPLKSATKEKNPQVELRLSETLLFLQTCRVTSKLDLGAMGEEFLALDRPYMAAVILSFMCRADQRRPIIKLLEPFKNEKLKRDIDELCEYGVMSRITQLAKRYLYCNPEDEDEDVDD